MTRMQMTAALLWGFVALAGVSLAQSGERRYPRTSADVDQMMQDLSNWGRWGEDDELGAINLVTPDKRKQAAQLVSEGVSVSLSHPAVKEDLGGSPGFEFTMVKDGGGAAAEVGWSADRFAVEYHGFTQSHIDALCHMFYKGKMYNGFSQTEVKSGGADKLDISTLRDGVVTRAVLFDMARHFNEPYLKGGHAIFPEDLEAWEEKAGVTIGPGDALLLRTGGWIRRSQEGHDEMEKSVAGLHASCLPWLKERDVALIGSDVVTDLMPSRVDGFLQPVHWVSIVAMGIPILDNLDLDAAAEQAARFNRWEFFVAVAPLAVKGGTGSPVNPIAVF